MLLNIELITSSVYTIVHYTDDNGTEYTRSKYITRIHSFYSYNNREENERAIYEREMLDVVIYQIMSELSLTYEPTALTYMIPRHVIDMVMVVVVVIHLQGYENLGRGQWQHCTKSNIVCCEVASRNDRDSSP